MIQKLTLPVAATYVNGDKFIRDGGYIKQIRGTATIKSWRIADLQSQEIHTAEIIGNQVKTIYMETIMPGQNVSMTNVRENQTTGVIIVDFSSGTQQEFASWEAVGEIADSIDATPAMAERILLGKAFRASPDGTNKTTQVGASVSTNLLASEPIVYTEAQ